MQHRLYSHNDVINITRDSIHLFINKQIDEFIKYLDNEFIFIADYDSLFLHGISEFMNYIKEEAELPPVNIRQEEYEIIAHERHLWVSCGRYIVSLNIGGQPVFSKHHFTFTWKQSKNDLKLIHAMACHLKDFPIAYNSSVSLDSPTQAKIFDTLPQTSHEYIGEEKISIRDTTGKIRFLYSDEILYIQADDKICNIFTKTGTFSSRMTLVSLEIPNLILIHKSYRANKQYIRDIHRYQVTLSNGAQIPVGKSKYMEIKKALFNDPIDSESSSKERYHE